MKLPFVLEYKPIQYDNNEATRIIFSKNTYSDKVKTRDWQHRNPPEPRNPEENLGPLTAVENQIPPSECICDHFKTTYQIWTDQLHLKNQWTNPYPHRQIFNYYGYRDEKINPKDFDSRNDFPMIMKNDYNVVPQYITTMHSSYASPLGIMMQRLRSPEERYLLHRRMKGIEDPTVNTKFRDDRMEEVNKALRCARKGMGISYNPMTGSMTDGSIPKMLSFKECHMVPKKSK